MFMFCCAALKDESMYNTNIWGNPPHCIYPIALSSSSEDSEEGTDEEIKSEESDFEEKAEMVSIGRQGVLYVE